MIKAEQLGKYSGMLMDTADVQAIYGGNEMQVSDYSRNPHFYPGQVLQGRLPAFLYLLHAVLLITLDKNQAFKSFLNILC